jgi:lambda family phage minor tail protein L
MPYSVTTSFKQEVRKLEADQILELFIIDLTSVKGYVSFLSTNKTITSNVLGGIFPSSRIKVGDIVEITGTASNNQSVTVVSISETVMVVSESIVTENNVKAQFANYQYFIDNLFNVFFFKMQSDALINTNQEYVRARIKRDNVKLGLQGEKNAIGVTFSNVDRVLESYVQNREYLRGCNIFIITAIKKYFPTGSGYRYIGTSSDKNSCMKERYYIDSVTSSEMEIKFVCSHKFSLREVQIPRRTYGRTFCSWAENYAGEECDPDDSINTVTYPTCDGSLMQCRARNNSRRFGGFPGIPKSGAIIQ